MLARRVMLKLLFSHMSGGINGEEFINFDPICHEYLVATVVDQARGLSQPRVGFLEFADRWRATHPEPAATGIDAAAAAGLAQPAQAVAAAQPAAPWLRRFRVVIPHGAHPLTSLAVASEGTG